MTYVSSERPHGHLLVVEDEPSVSALLNRWFRRDGFSVSVASTLREADDALAARGPDLIILDLHLPDGHGFDLLKQLNLASSPPPVIIISGRVCDDTLARGMEYFGAADFASKPLSRDLLRAKVVARLRDRHRGTNRPIAPGAASRVPHALPGRSPHRELAARSLMGLGALDEITLGVVREVLLGDSIASTENELSITLAVPVHVLRYRWRKTLGSRVTLKQFMIMGRQFRVLEMSERNVKAVQIADELNVDESTVYRDIRNVPHRDFTQAASATLLRSVLKSFGLRCGM